jgi:hypothetical protein
VYGLIQLAKLCYKELTWHLLEKGFKISRQMNVFFTKGCSMERTSCSCCTLKTDLLWEKVQKIGLELTLRSNMTRSLWQKLTGYYNWE